MNVHELDETTTGLAYGAMRHLRPDITDAAEFVERVGRQRAEGYRLVGSFDDSGAVVSVAGFRTGNCLAWGYFLYIDDLCTMPEARGQGHARALLEWIDAEALRLGCEQLHLDSATHRHDAHRRYLTSGYVIPAFHFSKPAPGHRKPA
jgi:GNAT superfamily N-acetyltransferase